MKRRDFIKTSAGAAAIMAQPGTVRAQDMITLRLHRFLPPQATVPAMILKP